MELASKFFFIFALSAIIERKNFLGGVTLKNEKILSPVIAGTFDISDVMTESEEIITAGNSFFDRSYFGTRVLVIAPRPGDREYDSKSCVGEG